MSSAPSDRSIAVAAAIDTAIVVTFVAVGRRNHDRDEAISGLVETAAPFVLALGVAWLIWRVWRAPLSPLRGIAVWATTLTVGMLLRRLLFDDGTATSFVIVAAVFLLLVVGWRVVADRVVVRRAAT